MKERVKIALKEGSESAKIYDMFCDARTTKNLSRNERIWAAHIDLEIRG